MSKASWKYLAIILLYAVTVCMAGTSAMEIDLDEKGVPTVDYGYVSKKGDSSATKQDGWIYVGKQRNPLTVSTQGMTYYNQYLQGNESSRELFLNCADWLLDNAAKRDNALVWEYKYSWPTYNNTPPFLSGMSQAAVIKVLATAYKLTGEEKYKDAAKKGLGAFFVDVENGGVTYKDQEGWWYEEYAQPGIEVEPRVLNGHIFALMDLNEYYNLTQDGQAKQLFNLGLSDLKARLKDYDAMNGSRYDRAGNLAVFKYHDIHVGQLNTIYKITGDPYFKLYRNHWAQKELALLQKDLNKTEKAISKLEMYKSELTKKKTDVEAMVLEEENKELTQTPTQQNSLYEFVSKLFKR
jgi:hypothetical protein